MGFEVLTEQRGGKTVYTLVDESTGASASILPAYGFNLFELKLPAGQGLRSIVSSAPGWADAPSGAAGNGFPVLFPYPNRIAGGEFSFAGKKYQLEKNNGPNAIHGFALDAPFDVIEQGSDAHGAFLAGRYRISKNTPKLASKWPTDAVLELKYTLHGRTLSLDATVTNPTDFELPYGLGYHPYFFLPFGTGKDLKRTKVMLPAAESWVLDEFIPTGERRPVEGKTDYRAGKAMEGLKADDVLTGLILDETGHATVRLIDEELGSEFRMISDEHFRELVVYTPPGRPNVVAVEHYTQTTDAINLHAKGIDGGLRLLEPGASETMHLRMETVDN